MAQRSVPDGRMARRRLLASTAREGAALSGRVARKGWSVVCYPVTSFMCGGTDVIPTNSDTGKLP
jgi:hypothetical protein